MGHESRLNPHAMGTGIRLDPVVFDAMGRALKEGDRVVLTRMGLIVWTVRAIASVIDPSLPPNLMRLELVAGVPMTTTAAQPTGELLLVDRPQRKGADDGSAALAEPDQQPETEHGPPGGAAGPRGGDGRGD